MRRSVWWVSFFYLLGITPWTPFRSVQAQRFPYTLEELMVEVLRDYNRPGNVQRALGDYAIARITIYCRYTDDQIRLTSGETGAITYNKRKGQILKELLRLKVDTVKTMPVIYRKVDFTYSDLRGADLQGAFLRGAKLAGADLRHASLRGADLRGADLKALMADSADFSRARLAKADLVKASLQSASLCSADLSGAILIDARLSGADARKTDFSKANLSLADLRHARLKNANFADAELVQTDLSNTNLVNANLSRAKVFRLNIAGAETDSLRVESLLWIKRLPGLQVSGWEDIDRKYQVNTFLKADPNWPVISYQLERK